MKSMPKFLNKMSWILRQVTAEFLISRDDHTASLAGIYHSDLFCQDVAILTVDGHALKLHILVSELIERMDLLNHMHPLDVALVRLLTAEELRGMYYFPYNNEACEESFLQVDRFACIEKHFVSDTHHKPMVVVTEPTSDKQICLTVQELINQQHLLRAIKRLSSIADVNNEQIEDVENIPTYSMTLNQQPAAC